MRLDFGPGSSAVVIRDDRGEHRLDIGYGDWHQGSTNFDSDRQRPYAASGAWTSPDTYVVKICFYTTPWRPTLTFQFGGDLLVYDFEYKASFGPTKRPQRVGRAN